MYPDFSPLVKCKHCGQWAAVFTACVHCGAPVDPQEDSRFIVPQKRFAMRTGSYPTTDSPKIDAYHYHLEIGSS